MTDTATTYNTLLGLLADADDGSGVDGVGWIAPGDVRSIVKSLATQYAINQTLPEGGVMPSGVDQSLTPGGVTSTSPGFAGAVSGDQFFKVATGQPPRMGSISVTGKYSTAPTAKGVLTVKVNAVAVLQVPISPATGHDTFAASVEAVTFNAGDAVSVECTNLNPAVLSSFRLGVTAGISATA